MKQFQNAAAKQYVMGNGAPQQMPQMSQNRGSSNDNMGLFNMVSNLFGSLNSDPVPSNMPAYAQNMNAQTRGMASQSNDKKQYEDQASKWEMFCIYDNQQHQRVFIGCIVFT